MVGDRKASKLPEAMVCDNPSDGCLGGVRAQERSPHEVHSAQGEIADGSHSQMLLTGGAKRSLRDSDGGANLGQIERPVGVRFQKPFEPRHDCIMAAATRAGLYGSAFGEAPHHDMNELLFQRPKYFRQFQYIGSVVGELSDRLVKL